MLLALLLILAGLAGAIAPQTAAAEENYYIWIGGKWITSDNYTNISASGGFEAVQSGTVTFDPATYTLTLNNATINTGGAAIFIRRQTTLVLQGSNTIITAYGAGIVIESMTDIISPNITGSGNLTIHSAQRVGIASNKDGLNITSCTLTVNGKIELPGGLTIRSSNVYVQGGPLKAGDISLSGCKIVHPADAASERIKGTPYYAVTSSSGEICTEVCISTGNQCHESTGTGPSTPTTFTFSPPEVILNAAGDKITVKLTCNKEFSCSTYDKPIWINAPYFDNGLSKEKYISFSAEPNTGDNRRRDEIVFQTSLGPATLKVTQLGANTKPEITLDPKELKVEAKGGEHKVTLSSTITIDDNMAAEKLPNWITRCRYSFSDHAGKIVDINITFQPNTGPERTADVVFKTSAGDVTLKVTQAAGSTKPEPEKPEDKLTLDPKELKVDAKGGEHKVSLGSKQDFKLNKVTLPNWINEGQTSSGPGLYGFTLKFQPNPGPERTADVVFKTDLGDVTLKVTQAGGAKPEPKPEAKFTLEPKELKVETDGGKKEVKLSCNQAFELNKVTVPSWMERVPSSATSDEKSRVCAFNIKPNTGAERKGEIIFHTDKGNITLKVTQAGKKEKPEPTLTLSPDMLTFTAGGGKQTVNVKSDYGWDTKASAASASWMKLTTDVKTGKIVVEVTPNTSTKKRGATIAVISSRRRIGHRTPITRHILVTQEAAKAVEPPVAATGISLNPAAMTMGSGGGTVGFNVYAGKGWTISGSPEWMHPDATRGSGTRLVIVRFDRNESGAERTGKLTVKSDDGKAERTFTLTQRAGQRKPTPSPGSTPSEEYDYDLALNPEEITVGPSDGAGSSISVATSRLWAGSTTEDWIRLESAVGRGNGTFTFTVAPNPSKEMRHGTITVRTQQGMDELKVAIHQQGNDGSVVPPAEVKVSNVTLDPATLTVNGDLSTALISAIVSPDNARNKGLLWMSSNASVATVQVFTPKQSAALPQLRFAPDADDYALVTIVGKGKAVITAAASDGSGIVARCEVNVLSTVANTVPDAPQAKVYTVGPTLYLSLPTPETVQVYTLAGTLYRTWQAPAGDTSVTLPLGTYIIKVGPLTEKVHVPR